MRRIAADSPYILLWDLGLTNTRTEPHDEIDAALDQMIWNMVRVPGWA